MFVTCFFNSELAVLTLICIHVSCVDGYLPEWSVNLVSWLVGTPACFFLHNFDTLLHNASVILKDALLSGEHPHGYLPLVSCGSH